MDALTQAASVLGLPLVEQGADGVVQLNESARTVLGDAVVTDVAAAVAQLTGCQVGDTTLSGALATARAGVAVSASLGTARVAFTPLVGGGVSVLVVPGSPEIERRAALVDAAAEVAHEVANALSAIAGWAEIGRTTRQRERVDEALDRIEASARSAREAARGLLGAARTAAGVDSDDGAHDAGGLDAAQLTLDVARTLGPLATSRGVRVDAAIAGVALVDDPAGQLWTAVWNLAKNAIEAATDGGLVELRVVTQARSVRVIVADDGPGMDQATRERAFAPYFTTKPDGTGLGLPLVKRAVEGLGGTLALEGRRAGGLRVVVTVPLAAPPSPESRRARSVRPPSPRTTRSEAPRSVRPPSPRATRSEAPRAVRPPSPRATRSEAPRSMRSEAPRSVRPEAPRSMRPPAAPRGRASLRESGVRGRVVLAGRHVLVVEDDAALRELVATTLGLRGAQVSAVASGAEARAQHGPFDLAIIDLTLGDTRGDHVLAELRASGVLRGPAIIATGRTLPDALEAVPEAVLRKPFAIEEMTELVAELAEQLPARNVVRG